MPDDSADGHGDLQPGGDALSMMLPTANDEKDDYSIIERSRKYTFNSTKA